MRIGREGAPGGANGGSRGSEGAPGGACGDECKEAPGGACYDVPGGANGGTQGGVRNGAWGVYVHVPFCVSRCRYCDFNTYSGMGRYEKPYFEALDREIGAFFSGEAAGRAYADTVFFGGGTPTSVDPAHIAGALSGIPRNNSDGTAKSRDGCSWECTIEANPGTLSPDKLIAYAAAGVNRLSIGLQSTHDAHLKMLGRIHAYADFTDNFRAARDAGFDNINADLIFGLPGQTAQEWEQTLESVVSLGIRHLSCYSLSLEEGTPLRAAVDRGELPAPDEDLDRRMYHFAIAYLASAGIYQYEISNFAEPGRECGHNLKYWTGCRYRGFGAGAHSYDGAARYSNARTIDGYIDRIMSCKSETGMPSASYKSETGMLPASDTAAAEEYEAIDAAEREKEFIILRLRLARGFCDAEFRRHFGYSFFDKYKPIVGGLAASGLIETGNDGGSVRLTPRGMDMANSVFIKFI